MYDVKDKKSDISDIRKTVEGLSQFTTDELFSFFQEFKGMITQRIEKEHAGNEERNRQLKEYAMVINNKN